MRMVSINAAAPAASVIASAFLLRSGYSVWGAVFLTAATGMWLSMWYLRTR